MALQLFSSRKCVLNVPVSKGERVIILNVGSENGWLHDDTLLLAAANIKDAKVHRLPRKYVQYVVSRMVLNETVAKTSCK